MELLHPKPVITKIFKLQKKAICIINGAKYNSHTESLFKKCKILPLPSLIEYFKIQFMQQYVRGHLSVSFNEVWITQAARKQNKNMEYLFFYKTAKKCMYHYLGYLQGWALRSFPFGTLHSFPF